MPRIRTKLFLASAVALTAGFVACVNDAFEDGRFSCSLAAAGTTDECPPGLICASDGRCRSKELTELSDGGRPIEDATSNPPDVDIDPDTGLPIDPCSLAWATTSTDRAPSALALDTSGRLFAGGSSAKRGWIAELHPCDGGVIREHIFDVQGAKEPAIQAMAVTGNDIVVGGALNASADGLLGRINKDTFTQNTFASVKGTGLIGLDHLAVADDGAVWFGGAQEIFAPTQTGWLIRVAPNSLTPTCNLRPSQAVGGLLPDASGRVIVELNEVNKTMLLDLAQPEGATCSLTVTGAAISFAAPRISSGWFLAGSRERLVLVGTNGVEANGGNERGLIAQRAAIDANIFTTTFLDPAPTGIDLVVRAATEPPNGQTLFAGGTHNASLTGGTPVVYRYALPLAQDATPVWSTPPYSGVIAPIQAMVVAPSGQEGVYVAGVQLPGRTNGAIAKCRKADGCKR